MTKFPMPEGSSALDETVPVHPVQLPSLRYGERGGVLSTKVTLRAYEVYQEVHGEQKALITEGCRGGFSVGELIAFLYARSFPKNEWRERCDEAFRNMRLGR